MSRRDPMFRLDYSVDSYQLQRSLRRVERKYKKKKILRDISRPAAKIIQTSVRSKMHELKRGNKHHRYLKGKRVATYYKGNMRRAYKIMSFRKSASLFTGPNYADKKGNPHGTFKGNRTDGFYTKFQEFGAEGIFGNPRLRIRPHRMIHRGYKAAETPAMNRLYRDLSSELAKDNIR